MSCPHYGADLAPEMISCPACGRAVAASVTAPEAVPRPDRRALMRWSLGIYVASFLVMIILGGRMTGADAS